MPKPYSDDLRLRVVAAVGEGASRHEAADRFDEIKHDGYRLIVRKEPGRITLYSRDGNNLTERFPLIVDALANLRSRSCIIDGEAVACGDDGIASFDHLQSQRFDEIVFLYAFDLIEFDGDDRRRDPQDC
jgi:bifunctional non-homologous end joining protein LigD